MSDLTNDFFGIWKKYKPVVLKMMIDSMTKSVQKYQFGKHEFTDVDSKKNTTYSFSVEVINGKPQILTKAKVSPLAEGLLMMLKRSEKGYELMESATYQFTMDKQFALHIEHKEVEKEVEEAQDDVVEAGESA